jgi:hypothetical protein
MPLEYTKRIWDIYIIEGPKVLYRIALGILKINEKELLKNDIFNLSFILNNYLDEKIENNNKEFFKKIDHLI